MMSAKVLSGLKLRLPEWLTRKRGKLMLDDQGVPGLWTFAQWTILLMADFPHCDKLRKTTRRELQYLLHISEAMVTSAKFYGEN